MKANKFEKVVARLYENPPVNFGSTKEVTYGKYPAIELVTDIKVLSGRIFDDVAKNEFVFTYEVIQYLIRTLEISFALYGSMGQKYDRLSDCIKELHEDRSKVAKSKRRDYTQDSVDVLKNFKNQSEALGVTPYQSLSVHLEKQLAAVITYLKTEGESESEPIIKRIGDSINYLELLWALTIEYTNE